MAVHYRHGHDCGAGARPCREQLAEALRRAEAAVGAEARIAPGMTVTEAIHRANKIAHRCACVRPRTCRD